ncbi:PMT1 [Enterospora canceri]|uniref:Dolichyl-phosphate-mannose--protein mannosyltransferase n=1 Tax=Enterospora canceri TaxID=1081671 RepID=A0A1Y1S6A1_9MICR|nr:PMT1 [Enterospora canceri]
MLLLLKNKELILIFMVSYIVKTYCISRGNAPIWDESHFGKFAYKYLAGLFYFDVHPPLGKMITAFAGWLSNQHEANYDYEKYSEYPVNYDYALNRSLHAAVGSVVPVFGYLILRLFGLCKSKSLMGSMLFIFDTGMTMICKIIVLDSHMLAFTALTSYLMCRYHFSTTLEQRNRLLPVIGLSLGCTISIKWIGCLTTVFLGAYIASQLLVIFYTKSLRLFFKQLALCSLFLIALPFAIYFGLFLIHFRICSETTADSASFSKEFNFRLKKNPYESSYKYVTFGRQITIKFPGGYLHSHPHTYPDHLNETNMPKEEYAKHLQVTVYKPRDENNVFFMQQIGEAPVVSFVKFGDEIALLHNETKAYVSIEGAAAFTTKDLRVTAYKGKVTENCIFVVEKEEGTGTGNIEAMSPFRLRHKATGKYLRDSLEELPSWGYSQNEVVASESNQNSNVLVEENHHSEPDGNELLQFKKRSFIWDFLEMQKQMFVVNQGLTTSRELEPHLIESMPHQWFVLTKGVRLVGWDNTYRYYLLMNPALLYSTSVSIIYTLFKHIISFLKFKRAQFEGRAKMTMHHYANKELFSLYFLIGGFLFHYAPCFLVDRVMYLHHYFPAYFFLILNLIINIRKWRHFNHFVLLIIGFYIAYSPLCYGISHTNGLAKLKLLPGWNFID